MTDTVVALGENSRLAGFPLAGVRLVSAETPDAVREAWASLPSGIATVILTSMAAEALGDAATGVAGPMTVVCPR
ncbi:MAG: hypothetical protein KF761_08455 [Salinibacterium sp.]|nr:hypothetical protein [Salinibacterium sp.]